MEGARRGTRAALPGGRGGRGESGSAAAAKEGRRCSQGSSWHSGWSRGGAQVWRDHPPVTGGSSRSPEPLRPLWLLSCSQETAPPAPACTFATRPFRRGGGLAGPLRAPAVQVSGQAYQRCLWLSRRPAALGGRRGGAGTKGRSPPRHRPLTGQVSEGVSWHTRAARPAGRAH